MFVIAATLRVRLLVNASSHGQRQVQVLKNLSDTRPRGRASTRTTQGQVSGAPRGDKPGGTGIEAEITSGVESQRANGGLNRPADETQAGEGIATNIDELDGKYEWIRENMPITRAMTDELPDLSHVRLVCCMHLDPKMSSAVFPLLEKGAEVFLTTCNPDTVDDEFVARAKAQGAIAAAWQGMSPDEWSKSLHEALRWRPTHLCDMGAQLTMLLMKETELGQGSVQAALEATGTGITRLQQLHAMPPYPIFNWDHVPIKSHVHNKHMVGLTAMCALYQATQLTLHGKRVLVIGGGLVGQGVAESARSFGAAEVVVAELDFARALALHFDTIRVATPASDDPNWLEAELELADIIVTATGARHVIGLHNIASVKDGSIILNVGHARDEIDVEGLYSTFSHSPVLKHLDRVIIDEERLKQSPRDGEGVHNQGRRVYLLAKGSMVNLIAAAGDSLNAFDVTLATMVAGIDFMARNSFGEHQEYSAGLHLLPADVCSRVAKEHLRLSSRTGNRL